MTDLSKGGTPSRERAAQRRDDLLRTIKAARRMRRAQIDAYFPKVPREAMTKYLQSLKATGQIEMVGHGVWTAAKGKPHVNV